MQIPPEVAFRHMDPTEAVEERLSEEIERLDELDDQLITCRVMVELPERRQRKGNRYHVRIDLTRPGEEIVVDRHPVEHTSHEDPLIAIGEAFGAARKRLVEAKSRRRGEVKAHEEPPRGRILRIFDGEDYGFIETADGREVYFHRNAVTNGGFDRLSAGMPVRYVEEQGEEGPQATVVEPLAPGREEE